MDELESYPLLFNRRSVWTRLQFFQAVFISRLDLNTYWRFTGSELMGKSVRLDGDIIPAEGCKIKPNLEHVFDPYWVVPSFTPSHRFLARGCIELKRIKPNLEFRYYRRYAPSIPILPGPLST
ncbi:MAG: hypothetical protein WAW42_11875 [Candidatus Competibacteraceae bacterium]